MMPVALALIVAVLIVIVRFTPAVRAGAADGLPEDTARLGLVFAKSTDAPATSPGYALARAAEVIGRSDAESTAVEAYYVIATDPASTGLGGNAIIDRPMWLVRYSSLEIHFPGPVNEDGTVHPGHIARFAYVLIDAKTGDPLDLQYWE